MSKLSVPFPRPTSFIGVRVDFLYLFKREVFYTAGLPIALAAGLAVRLFLIVPAGFPLNDGGMFYAMTRDLQQSTFMLPAYSSYNAESIPFAYPPLGFYVAGITQKITSLPLEQVIRFIPFLFNALSIAAFYYLCRSLTSSRIAAAFGVVGFVLLPRSFTWLIVGGGLTRSIAFFFSIIAIYNLYHLLKGDEKRFLPAAITASLAVLAHPQGGMFTIFTACLLFLFYGHSKRSFLFMFTTGASIFVITAPWWGFVVARHGLSPMVGAFQTGHQELFLSYLEMAAKFAITEEPMLPILAFLGMLGMFTSIARGNFFLPAWLILILVLDPRSGTTYATLPLGMFIGLALGHTVLPAIKASSRIYASGASPRDGLRYCMRTAVPIVSLVWLFGYLFIYAFVGAMKANSDVLKPVSRADLTAMEWVAQNTALTSTFAVISYRPWPIDRVAEWFPALANRKSVTTVQGSEWFGKESYTERADKQVRFAVCAMQNAACFDNAVKSTGVGYDYLYLSSGCCSNSLAQDLQSSADYRLTYDQNGVTIWEYHRLQPTTEDPITSSN